MKKRRFKPGAVAAVAALLAVAFVFLMPLVWMVSTSLKPERQAASQQIRLLPDPAGSAPSQAVENYSAVWNDSTVQFPLYLRNTLIVAFLAVTGVTISSAMVAYGLSRIRWKGRSAVFAVTLATMMIPFPVLMVPLFAIFKTLGWNGTLAPLWVPAWFGGAFNIFMLRQFFMGIPRELDEAARIDGMGHWGIFWRVIVPLSRPALAVVALFNFVYVWNDFIGPLIYLHHRDTYTLALGLQLYQSQAGQTPWNLLMAASTMVVLPLVLLFIVAQGSFVRGVSAEGLKG
ncbi:MAG TPA: carbohydrate ABC transporter permease [Phycisphaerales bacterium]|nr:carbohydrate ABC transporter permease [Phycisphaerales bacterium]